MIKKINISCLICSLGVLAFIVYKLLQLTYRFGDGNVYPYMAKELFAGQLPYRNYFLADPPFFIIFLGFFRLLFGNNAILYQTLAVLLEGATGIILSLFVKNQRNKLFFLAPIFYLFSFTVLATSDYLTGTQLVVFLSIAGIYAWEKKRFSVSGILWALAFLTKLHALPGLIGFVVYLLFIKKENRESLFKFFAGILGTSFIVLMPFIVLAFPQMFNDMIFHQLHRPQGDNKLYIFQFFILKEWLLITFALAGIFLSKNKVTLLPFIFTLIFFIFYRDIYYLYLDILMPYLIIYALFIIDFVRNYSVNLRRFANILIVLYLIFIIFSIYTYRKGFINQGRFYAAEKMANYIKNVPDLPLYGSHEITPLIALITGKQIFHNYIDTNSQIFASGSYNKDSISNETVKKGIYLLSRIIERKDYGITNRGYEGFFSQEIFKKYCKRIKSFPSNTGEMYNQVAVFKCQRGK